MFIVWLCDFKLNHFSYGRDTRALYLLTGQLVVKEAVNLAIFRVQYYMDAQKTSENAS